MIIRIGKSTILHLYRNLGINCNSVIVDLEATINYGKYIPQTIIFEYVGKMRGKRKK